MNKFLPFCFLFWSFSSWAGDILFIDINNVIPEIRVVENYLNKAQKLGHEKGTRLVVVPSYNTFTREQRKELEKISLRSEHLLNNGGDVDEIKMLGRQIREIKTGDPDREYQLEDLLSELKTVVSDEQYDFDRIFISGHHSPSITGHDGILGGEFLNGFGAITAAKILNNAPTTKNVHSLVLLGCHTGTREMMGSEHAPWAAVLPQSLFHFGYNNPAPLKTDIINLNILQRVIAVQNFIASKKDKRNSLAPAQLGAVSQLVRMIPTQGRDLGVRVGDTYIKHPVRR